MLRHGDFNHAASVLEFGCGTGRMAERLLSDCLPATSRYLGIDISETMIDLARKRLRPSERSTVRVSDGSCTLLETDGSVDRVVSTYVLDLLSRGNIDLFLREAFRVLAYGGSLCLASLSHGQGVLGGSVSSIWIQVHALSPWIVGGCRPIDLRGSLSPSLWQFKCIQPYQGHHFTGRGRVQTRIKSLTARATLQICLA